MTEAERREILDQARETCDRLGDFRPRELSVERERARVERAAPEPKPKREPELTEYERARARAEEWQAWVTNLVHTEIGAAVRAVTVGIAEATREALDRVEEEIATRDRKIEKLEVEITKARAELARLEVRVIELDHERDRERRSLPLMPAARRDLN
jgi:hypothetical protein